VSAGRPAIHDSARREAGTLLKGLLRYRFSRRRES